MAGWLIGNSVTTSTAVVSSFKVFFCFVTTRCLSAVVVLQPPCTYTATFWLVWSPSWTISSFQKRTRSGGGGRIKLKGVADQSLPRFHVPTVVVRDTGKMLYTIPCVHYWLGLLWANLKDWLLTLVDGVPLSIKGALKSLIKLVIWEIWRERNNRIFRKVGRSMSQILSDIQDEAKTWKQRFTAAALFSDWPGRPWPASCS